MTSTRTEIAGAIAGLCIDGPRHIQCDSTAMAGRAQELVLGSFMRKRPWALLPDGDLWAMLEEAILAKGPHAVRFSWGKGHASLWTMDAQVVDTRLAIANGYADLAADEGHSLFNRNGIKTAASFIAAKRKASAQLFAAIQRRLARVQAAFALRIEEAEACKAAERHAGVAQSPIPTYGDFHATIRLSFLAYPIGTLGIEEQEFHIGLRLFWSNLWFRFVSTGVCGTSWVELFALWHSRWGEPRRVKATDLRQTFSKGLANFIKRSKAFFAHGDASTRALTRTSRTRFAPLVSHGLTSSTPTLNARVVLQPELAA